jgi:uncharacterized protein (DUF1697 family)
VNVGGNRMIKMDALRALCDQLGLNNPRTLIQSGNVVFETSAKDMAVLAKRIERAVEQAFGFHSDVILRTASDMRQVVEASPFADRSGFHPGKLLITFLADDPGEAARENVRQLPTEPEELYINGRELYIYFPNGMGRSKLSISRIEKALKTAGTSRNWNTVRKLLDMAAPSKAHKTSA